jgi:hypothetical protein
VPYPDEQTSTVNSNTYLFWRIAVLESRLRRKHGSEGWLYKACRDIKRLDKAQQLTNGVTNGSQNGNRNSITRNGYHE